MDRAAAHPFGAAGVARRFGATATASAIWTLAGVGGPSGRCRKKPWYERPVWWVAGAMLVVILIGGSAGGQSDTKPSTAPSKGSASKATGNPNRPNEATPSNTPRVDATQAVTVDALAYRFASARTAKQVGDAPTFGATANGTFVIVDINIHSDKHDSVTLTSDSLKLTDGRNDYSVSTDATVALIGSEGKPIFLEQVDPQSDLSGTLVYDVPPAALSGRLEMKFSELGAGSTKAYIALPPLA